MKRARFRNALTGLGAVSEEQITQSNAMIDRLTQRLARQFGIIRDARGAGFDSDVIVDANAEYERLTSQLTGFFATAPDGGLSAQAFDEWITRLRGLESQVAVFEQTTTQRLGRAAPQRTAKIVISTAGAVGAAALVAALVWYFSRPGYVLAKRGWATRRKRGY